MMRTTSRISPCDRNDSSPWGKVASVDVNLEDIMSEQLADKLYLEEIQKNYVVVDEHSVPKEDTASTVVEINDLNDPTINDRLLAEALQLELDREHDENLKALEKAINKDCKVRTSLEKYRLVHPFIRSSGSRPASDLNDFDSDDISYYKEDNLRFSKSGLRLNKGELISKHDVNLASKKHMRSMDYFPPEIDVGDSDKLKVIFPNKVYNELRLHTKTDKKRAHKEQDKKFEKATSQLALDRRTLQLLFRLVNRGILEDIEACVATGKEASVFYAKGGFWRKSEPIPAECALKVFHTTLSEFKTREKYIKDDYRFQKRFISLNTRKFIRLWAEKEYHHLNLLYKAGIPCPIPVYLRENVILMSFIGLNGEPAPCLKDIDVDQATLQLIYDQTLNIMKTMYNECDLIHADFSEYNLLWFDGIVWVIDVSQSVSSSHPESLTFLFRDCTNISNFFGKKGCINVQSPRSLFKIITGLHFDVEDEQFLIKIQKYPKTRRNMTDWLKPKEFNFDYFFDNENTKRDSADDEAESSEDSDNLKSPKFEDDDEKE